MDGSTSGYLAEDALDVKKMNVNPRGKQPRMHDTVWSGRPQQLVNLGIPKGMKKVLEERGINTQQMT